MMKITIVANNGFSLFEVLIALIISVGLSLSILIIQTRILQNTQKNYHYALANQQLINWFEQALLSQQQQSIAQEIKQLLPEGQLISNIEPVQICWREKNARICLH